MFGREYWLRLAISVPEETLGLWRAGRELVVARAGLCGFGQGLPGLAARALPAHLLPSFSNNYICAI